jgi:hypothetical protein
MTLPALETGQIWMTADQNYRFRIGRRRGTYQGAPEFALERLWSAPGFESMPGTIRASEVLGDCYPIWGSSCTPLTTLLYHPGGP